MSRLGVLRNPAASGNRGAPPVPLPPGVLLAEAGEAGLDWLLAQGAEVIVIDGGDGTVRAAASHLLARFGTAAPPIAILARGNTNLIARKAGRTCGPRGLARLAAGEGRAGRLATIRLDRAGQPPIYGFICGWGAYATATRIAGEEGGGRGAVQVVRTVATTLRRTLFGAAGLRQGVAADLAIEGAAQVPGPRFLGLATSLTGPLIAGLDPFWGGGAGAIRWLDVSAPPRRLWLAAPFVALGRPRGWMAAAGYRSGTTARIALTLAGDLVLDGDLVQAGGAVTLTPGPDLAVLRTAG